MLLKFTPAEQKCEQQTEVLKGLQNILNLPVITDKGLRSDTN